MIDLLITNGLVIDGSGSPGFFAAVLVEGETVTVQRGEKSYVAVAEPTVGAIVTINGLMNVKYGWADDYIDMLFGRSDAIAIRLLRKQTSTDR